MQNARGLLDRIFSKKQNNKTIYDKYIRIHHEFMKEYGWIHPDVFYNLPLDFINNMSEHINHDRKEENKQIKKAKR